MGYGWFGLIQSGIDFYRSQWGRMQCTRDIWVTNRTEWQKFPSFSTEGAECGLVLLSI